jgi:hypothetical protein
MYLSQKTLTSSNLAKTPKFTLNNKFRIFAVDRQELIIFYSSHFLLYKRMLKYKYYLVIMILNKRYECNNQNIDKSNIKKLFLLMIK